MRPGEELGGAGRGTSQDQWSTPQPAFVPEPTYWPATLALGVVLLLWGVVTSAVISSVGLVMSVVALAGWIGDIRHERHD
jgi:hypothetical protein